MKCALIASLLTLSLASPLSLADSTVYCPGRSGFIKIGMNSQQVLAACGEPSSVEHSKQPLMEQIPVTQLIYTNLFQGTPYRGLNKTYKMWSLPSGSTEINLMVTVMNDQISAIEMNGASSNALSICGGKPFQIGDNPNTVYAACGSPSAVNQTYIKRPVPSVKNSKPEVWLYQKQYQPTLRLVFLNGILQSIDQS